jgi:hypothetical protein
MSGIQNRIVGVIGRKGSGKSTRFEELLETRDRIIIFDPMAEHDWTPNELAGPKPVERAQEFFAWAKRKPQWAANFVPGDDLEADLEELSRMVYSQGDCAFGVEEISLVCTANQMPKKFGKLVRTGRHRGIDLYWTGLRASEVPRTLTSLTDEFHFFSQTEPLDLDKIAGRCGPEVAGAVARLGMHGNLTWDVINRRICRNMGPAVIETPPLLTASAPAAPSKPGLPEHIYLQ